MIISPTQDELLAKKSTGNKSSVDDPVDQKHCDKKGYPSCYNVGYSDGQNAQGTSCPSGHSETYCNGYEAASSSGNSSGATYSNLSSSSSSGGSGSSSGTSDLKNIAGAVDQKHCDKKGYPSCYNVGYSDGQNAQGTSCPSGHSETYCNGYEGASSSGNSSGATYSNLSSSSSSGGSGSSSGTSDLKNIAGAVDQKHCDKKGYPSCYNVGYSDGQNAQGTSCPSGHSETYCNGYEAASSLNQNSKTKINQGAVNDANINVNNSSGTRITNEQTIKQSVRINNEINNLIRNNQVNKIIKENTVSAPQQPLTDLLTVKLS